LVTLAIGFSNEVEDWQAEEDQGGAQERTPDVAGVAPDENGSSRDDEYGGKERISPDAVGAGELGVAAAIDEDGSGGEHVEQPFGENGKLKVLLELTEKKQKNG